MTKKKNGKRQRAKQPDANPFPVVGIGASAGGLMAFATFIKHTPPDTGMAFVLVQHLDPHHESELAELLQNHTSMPVTQVIDQTEVAPNHIYVIPPNKRLGIEKGVLKLSERAQRRGSHAMIDLFFRALAQDQGEHAVCVVLSGTGTDGTQGLKAIKEAGGLTFAQREEDAEYGGMPQSAAATGLVDFVLDAADIPKKLIEVKDHANKLRLPDGDERLPEDDSDALQRIFTQLQTRTGHDFSNYKRNTVLRRIGRRMQVHGLSGLKDYLGYLRDDEGEAGALFKELLISVTNFFRDREAFEALENHVIPELFAGDEVRVWVAGCATGEEAYSIAMLLAEHNDRREKPLRVQVFASDIDEKALAFARQGVYPDSIAADVSQERLSRFFKRDGNSFVVNERLREMVLFATHNLIKDPPFSKIGLVTCRNLLIYLNSGVQEQVYKVFHYALKPKGYLFLGASESLGKASELFREVKREKKLFQRREGSDTGLAFPLTPVVKRKSEGGAQERVQESSLAAQAQRTVLSHHAPAFAVVNDAYDIVYVSGRTGKYLEHPEGEPTNNIVQQARDGLALELRTALYRLFRQNSPTVNKAVTLHSNSDTLQLELSVSTLEDSPDHALVLFQARPDAPESTAVDEEGETPLVAQLEDELNYTRESLQTTIEELETSNEELRASNEELQSMNEELQSTTEELETSKEELQSTNEELITVNQELRNKIDELAAVNSDLENLISSTDVGTIFLDAELRLKRYTPRATEVFNLIPGDLGRPFAHISHALDLKTLDRDAEQVLETLRPVEREAASSDGAYIIRLSPYRTLNNRIDGVVLTAVDVTDLERAKSLVAQRAEQQAVVAELGQLALGSTPLDELMQLATTHLHDALQADFVKVLELLKGEDALILRAGVGWDEGIVGQAKVGTELDSQAGFTLHSKEPVIVEDLSQETRFSGPALLTDHEVTSGVSVIIQGTDKPWGVLGVHTRAARDFSQDDVNFIQAAANVLAEAVRRRRAEQALQESNIRLEQRVKARTQQLREQATFLRSIYDEVGLAVYVIDVEEGGFRHADINPTFTRMTGVKREQVVGKRPEELTHLPEAAREAMRAQYEQVAGSGDLLEYEVGSGLGGDETWWLVTLNPVKDDENRVYRIIGTGLPITERKEAELAVKEAKEFSENLIESSVDGILAFDTELRYTVFNKGMTRISGVEAGDALGRYTYDVFPFLEEIGEVAVQRATLEGQYLVREDQPYDVPETGESGFFEAHYSPLSGGNGQIAGGLAIVRDTTERKGAEDKLKASEERFRAVFEQGPSATCLLILDDWTIIDANDKCEDVLGYARGELTGQSLLGLDLWQDKDELKALEKLIQSEDDRRELELRVNRDGNEPGVLCASLELVTFGGEEHVLLIFEDITKRKRTDEELKKARLELIEVRDRERVELARELHDTVIQQLLGLTQALSQLEKGASEGHKTSVNVGVHRQEVLRLVEQLRRTISDLRPAGLEEFGLKATLEGFILQLRRTHESGPRLRFQIGETGGLSQELSLTLFRVAQEALRNALTHAEAGEVKLELDLTNGEARLKVEDDGQGFEQPERLSAFVQDDHFGLVGIQERVELLGGDLSLKTAPGGGTTLSVTLPLEAQDG